MIADHKDGCKDWLSGDREGDSFDSIFQFSLWSNQAAESRQADFRFVDSFDSILQFTYDLFKQRNVQKRDQAIFVD